MATKPYSDNSQVVQTPADIDRMGIENGGTGLAYMKSIQVGNLLAKERARLSTLETDKANGIDVTNALNLKADKATTYTKTENDGITGALDTRVSANETDKATLDTVPTFNGIQFPSTQVASADINTLDDYEEGTFTPTLTIDGDSTGVTYLQNSGAYTKIGNTVNFTIGLTLTSKGSNIGILKIANLPFAIGDLIFPTSLESVAIVGYYRGISSSIYGLTALMINSVTSISLIYKATSNGFLDTYATESSIVDSFNVRITGTYFTN